MFRDGFRWQLIGTERTRRRDISGSATAIWIIVAVAVAGLAVWLGNVALAARKPYQGRVRAWADAQDKPTPRYRDAHIWYDAGSKQNFTAYKLLFSDIDGGRQVAVPQGIMAAGNIMQGSRGGIDLPEPDITRKCAR